jgi:hypothetical protein
MANIVPLAVSGQIGPTQLCLVMTIIDATPYYLVTDIAGIPYFQPIYQDVSTGLAIFSTNATRATVTIGARGTNDGISTTITEKGHGPFLVDPNSSKIVAANSIASGSSLIPIEPISYINPGMVTCGYNYVLSNSVSFFISTNWSATPNAQSISNIQQLPTPANSFYVFPTDGLYNNKGEQTSDVFTVIYNDILGKGPGTFLFTSYQAYQYGAGIPFYYCAKSQCGPNCFGQCNGKYEGCERMKDDTFSCGIEASATCKILAVLPFLLPAVISFLTFFIIFLTSKYARRHPTTGRIMIGAPKKYILDLRTKIILIVLLLIPAVLCIISLVLVTVDNEATNRYLRVVCAITGEFQ